MRSRTKWVGAILSLVATGAVLIAAQQDAAFSAEDMLAIRTFAGGQPIAVSPTGRRVAYVLTDPSDEWNVQEPRPTGYIYVQSLGKAAAPRALTSGAIHSAFPVWSPDGRRLAFIREEQRRSLIVVWDAERDQMTPVGETFTARVYLAPQWDPSGKAIIVAAPQADPPPPAYRVRTVRSTDVRVPGDQFFVDDRKAMLKAIDIATSTSNPLMPTPAVLRSFRVSPTGRHAIFVAPVPETLGVIGKEQNDTFVVSIDLAKPARISAPRRLAERGRFSWSPDGRQLLFSKGNRLMALAADGIGDAKPWRESFTLAAGEPIWSPDGTYFATLAADPTLSDPELEPVRPGMYTTAQPYNDVYVVGNDGIWKNVTAAFEDQVTDPVWSADGSTVYFRAIDNTTYDETVYRYTIADQKVEPIVRGEESYGRFAAAASDGLVALIEDATHPPDLWLIGPGQRTRITDLNPQLARFAFSKPELFYFYNADGDR